MATGDWIKMRTALSTHPKVVHILSATCTDKFSVIGGLFAVWAVFDTHSTDGRLVGYTPKSLDHVIGWEGFSQAMIEVNWLIYDGNQTIELPEFNEHNGQSAKRRAEDQKRKKLSRQNPQYVQELSDDIADKMRTGSGLEGERDKRKRKAKTSPSPPLVLTLPDWLPQDVWDAYLKMRVRIRKPATEEAKVLAIQKLDVLRLGGHDVRAILQQSVLNSWQGLFPLKGTDLAGGKRSAIEQRNEDSAREWASIPTINQGELLHVE